MDILILIAVLALGGMLFEIIQAFMLRKIVKKISIQIDETLPKVNQALNNYASAGENIQSLTDSLKTFDNPGKIVISMLKEVSESEEGVELVMNYFVSMGDVLKAKLLEAAPAAKEMAKGAINDSLPFDIPDGLTDIVKGLRLLSNRNKKGGVAGSKSTTAATDPHWNG